MIDIVCARKGSMWVPWSEHDRLEGLKFPELRPVHMQVSGSKKMRSYRELCAYKSSCSYISTMGLGDNLDTKDKVDELTKCLLGFLRGDPIVRPDGGIQFLTDSLSYANCDQQRSHQFITKALEYHADLVGLTVEEYLKLLNDQK